MPTHSKAYRKGAEKIFAGEVYAPRDAVRLAKETSPTKFDATVEVVFRLGVDPRKADQMVRGTVNLPHGTGKTARVLVFAQGAKAQEATDAGADGWARTSSSPRWPAATPTSTRPSPPRTSWARSADSAASSARAVSCRTRRPAP